MTRKMEITEEKSAMRREVTEGTREKAWPTWSRGSGLGLTPISALRSVTGMQGRPPEGGRMKGRHWGPSQDGVNHLTGAPSQIWAGGHRRRHLRLCCFSNPGGQVHTVRGISLGSPRRSRVRSARCNRRGGRSGFQWSTAQTWLLQLWRHEDTTPTAHLRTCPWVAPYKQGEPTYVCA